MMLEIEEEIVEEETQEAWEDLLEDDEISPEEQGFMLGWIEAGKSRKKAEITEE
ncbi:hypothetical protein KY341_02600 [Candidatus Woesearchaeota archaeon]|nr:hypothetical protein [Candidatus Woesearchaeota archaeon]